MTYPYDLVHISISNASTSIPILCGISLTNVGSYGYFHASVDD